MHIQTCDKTQRYTKRENRPFRSVRHGWDVGKLLFASFQFKADPLLFCLWMFSSCSSTHAAASAASVLVGSACPPVFLPPLLKSTRDRGGDVSPPVNYNPASFVYLYLHTLSLSCRHLSVKYEFSFFFPLSSPASVLGFASQGRLTD